MENNKNTDQNVNLEDNNQNNEPNVNESNNDSNNNSSSNNDSSTVKTFTQEQVNSMMAREKKQGKNSVFNELGIDSNEEETIKLVKSFIEFQKTNKAESQNQNGSNSEPNSELEQRVLIAEAKAEAVVIGIKPQFVEDAIALALPKLNDENDLKTVLAEYKVKYPAWFGLVSSEDDNSNEDGTGSTPKGSTKKDEDSNNKIGARLAAKRVKANNQKSFWGN